jgi:signal transduction histidine kinase
MSALTEVPFEQNRLLRSVPPGSLQSETLPVVVIEMGSGEVVFEAGAPADACYLIQQGSVRISVPGTLGEYETVAILGPGDFFGELALYQHAVRSARASTLERTRLGRLDDRAFEALRDAAPMAILSAIAEANMERVCATNLTLIQQLGAAGRLREIGLELGTIAHNLRSPLATVVAAADLLRELLESPTPPAAEMARFIDIVRRAATQGLHSADELLSDLRGDGRAKWSVTAPAEIIAAVEQQVRGLVNSSITLTTTVSAQARCMVHHNELTAAIVNLIRNSVEALPPEGGSVTLAATEEGGMINFLVTDNGSGIPENVQQRIFEPSFTHGKAGGTGLGLTHVRKVAQRHGGGVELLYSSSDSGTAFRLTVPVRVEEPRH